MLPKRQSSPLPGRRNRFAAVVWDPADAAALSRPPVSLHLAVDGTGLGRLHLDRRRECRGGAVQRFGFERFRYIPDAAASGPAHGAFSLNALRLIGLEMLLPFVAGQLLQPWIGSWVQAQRRALSGVDRGSVLLVVYTAFSGTTLSGIWHQLAFGPLMALFAAAGSFLLTLMLTLTALTARGLGFSREDQIAIVFCGSKKSLVTGIPMANLLFAGHALGLIVLPLMVFYQIQLPRSPGATPGL